MNLKEPENKQQNYVARLQIQCSFQKNMLAFFKNEDTGVNTNKLSSKFHT